MSDLYPVLSKAVSNASGILLKMNLRPANADGLVYPPTYEQGYHIFRPAWINGEKRDAVILDSVQSQANRIELAILDAYRRKLVEYPEIELVINANTGKEVYSVLELSHRIYDAVLRMSKFDGVLFPVSEIGKAVYSARIENASALYTHAPITLALGGWDSHGGGGPLVAKLPRLLTSEIIGLDAQSISRAAVKFDPMDIRKEAGPLFESKDPLRRWEVDKDKAKKGGKPADPSNAGFGNIPPELREQGAVITEALQTSLVSCTAVRRIRFGKMDETYDDKRDLAGQVAVVALALFGLVAQMESGYYLRSGCNLFPVHEPKLEIVGRTLEEVDTYPTNVDETLKALNQALVDAETQGLAWRKDKVVLEADERLITLVERSRNAGKMEG
jgi:CRISPR-associated protein Csb1